MFERYTEGARRVIFFARYEAGACGSSTIEPEHILLGLLREDHFTREAIGAPRTGELAERLRAREETGRSARGSKSQSMDVPLSHESKRVLAFGTEEAERLGSRSIGCCHLLMGILREQKSFAAGLLTEAGHTRDALRAKVAGAGAGVAEESPPDLSSPPRGLKGPEHLLLAMLHNPESELAVFLREHGVTPEAIRKRFGIE